jgi:hypothetical protein
MNITIKDLQDSIRSAFSFDPLPRKIKLTSKASAILEAISIPVFQEMSQEEYMKMYTSTGAIGRLDGIPIEIDDTIENEYYELVYEEN